MVVMMDVQFLGESRANVMWAVVQLAFEFGLESGCRARKVIVLRGFMVHELFSQGLNLVVGILEKLSKLGDAKLEICVVLEKIANEMTDNRVVFSIAL